MEGETAGFIFWSLSLYFHATCCIQIEIVDLKTKASVRTLWLAPAVSCVLPLPDQEGWWGMCVSVCGRLGVTLDCGWGTSALSEGFIWGAVSLAWVGQTLQRWKLRNGVVIQRHLKNETHSWKSSGGHKLAKYSTLFLCVCFCGLSYRDYTTAAYRLFTSGPVLSLCFGPSYTHCYVV